MPELKEIPVVPEPPPVSIHQRLDELENLLENMQQELVIGREHERQEYFQRTVSDLLQAATAAGPLSKPRKQKRSFSFTLALWKFYLRGEISS